MRDSTSGCVEVYLGREVWGVFSFGVVGLGFERLALNSSNNGEFNQKEHET